MGMNLKLYGNAQKTRETCGTNHFEKKGRITCSCDSAHRCWSALPLTNANAVKMSRLFDNLHHQFEQKYKGKNPNVTFKMFN